MSMFPFKSNSIFEQSKLMVMGVAILSLILVLMLAGCSPATTTSAIPTSATTNLPIASTSASPSLSPSPSPVPTKHSNTEVILSSTTSVRDSGLMDKLIPVFEQNSGYKMKPIYNGSGAALALGSRGEVDVLLVHSPAAEIAFMDAGNGSDRRLIMHNDFIVLGPAADPAKVKGSTTAQDAFKKIADAKANFYSRGDNSGTDAAEKGIFKTIGITVKDKAPENPGWYIESGSGMGQLLLIASDKQGYTLSDRATYLANKANISLDILFEGDPALLNLYHVIQVNSAKFPGIINTEGARAFADFIVGPTAQDIIGKYTDKNGVLLFVPDGGKTDADLGVK
jgi:tungstate transport system substrate-binding protein